MPRPIRNSVVVVTGASSGIGRAAALGFARRGARLALAARSRDALEEIADECRGAGGDAIVVPTDVADSDAVQRLADSALERYGRIDTWVNNAGVIAYGRFTEVPASDFRRVIETNLFGQVNGARAVVPQFRAQGSGVLINVASVWGRVTSPDVSPYVTSKHAVRAFSECLRFELQDAPDIHITSILPQAVDTPIFDNAANYRGQRVRPLPPLLDAEHVAEGIVRCAESPRPEVTFGRAGRALEVLYALAPRLFGQLTPSAFAEGSFASDAAEIGPGNLWKPTPGPIVGGWKDDRRGVLIRAFLDAAGRGSRKGVRRLFSRP